MYIWKPSEVTVGTLAQVPSEEALKTHLVLLFRTGRTFVKVTASTRNHIATVGLSPKLIFNLAKVINREIVLKDQPFILRYVHQFHARTEKYLNTISRYMLRLLVTIVSFVGNDTSNSHVNQPAIRSKRNQHMIGSILKKKSWLGKDNARTVVPYVRRCKGYVCLPVPDADVITGIEQSKECKVLTVYALLHLASLNEAISSTFTTQSSKEQNQYECQRGCIYEIISDLHPSLSWKDFVPLLKNPNLRLSLLSKKG